MRPNVTCLYGYLYSYDNKTKWGIAKFTFAQTFSSEFQFADPLFLNERYITKTNHMFYVCCSFQMTLSDYNGPFTFNATYLSKN